MGMLDRHGASKKEKKNSQVDRRLGLNDVTNTRYI